MKIQYRMKVKELDDATNYPVDVLVGMTGLGFQTVERLASEGHFAIQQNEDGTRTVKGKDFLDWASSVNHTIEVEKTEYPTMKVDE